MNATQSNRKTAGVAGRVEAADWESLVNNLDTYGCAVIKGLLAPKECRELSSLYDHDEHSRSRVVMAQHGFGRGEYKYWSYPLPKTIKALRTTLYPTNSTRKWRCNRLGRAITTGVPWRGHTG